MLKMETAVEPGANPHAGIVGVRTGSRNTERPVSGVFNLVSPVAIRIVAPACKCSRPSGRAGQRIGGFFWS